MPDEAYVHTCAGPDCGAQILRAYRLCIRCTVNGNVTGVWWERRRDGELTPNYLGRVLDKIGGLGDMPRRAREGHFDDYAAPAEVATGFELIALVRELTARGQTLGPLQRERIAAVIAAVKAGEFDATAEEADRWMASKDGQDTIKQLTEGR